MRKIKLTHLYILFVLLSIADLICTIIIVGESPKKELNPVARMFIISDFGYWAVGLYKALVVYIIGFCVYIINKQKPVYARWILNFGVTVTAMVCVYHVYLFVELYKIKTATEYLSQPFT